MPKYEVHVSEVHKQTVLIEADTVQEAIQRVLDGDGEQIELPVYDYTLDEIYGALNLDTGIYEEAEV